MDGLRSVGLGSVTRTHGRTACVSAGRAVRPSGTREFTFLQFYSLQFGTINSGRLLVIQSETFLQVFYIYFPSSNGLSRFLDKNCIISQIGNRSVKVKLQYINTKQRFSLFTK